MRIQKNYKTTREFVAVAILVIGLVLCAAIVSYGITAGAVWLICHLMHWTFSIRTAAAVWIALCVVSRFLKGDGKDGSNR